MNKSQLASAQQEMRKRMAAAKTSNPTNAMQQRNQEIADAVAAGESVSEVAEKFCLTRATIYHIINTVPASERARERGERNLERELAAVQRKQEQVAKFIARMNRAGLTINDLITAEEQ